MVATTLGVLCARVAPLMGEQGATQQQQQQACVVQDIDGTQNSLQHHQYLALRVQRTLKPALA